MNHETLRSIVEDLRLRGTDVHNVEVKSAQRGLPKSIVESISSLANGQGGIIILGLDENEGFSLVPGFTSQPIADSLADTCSNKLVPPVRAVITIEPFDGGEVVVAEIPETAPFDKPCWVLDRGKYKGSFTRGHDGDRHLTPYEIDRIEENKRQPTWDVELVEEATIEDFDEDILRKVLDRERNIHPAVFGRLSDEKAMLSLHIIGRDSQGVLRPTLGGLLALGSYPQQFFPRLNVTFAAYVGTDKSSNARGQRFVDNASFVGPIPVLVEEAVRAVLRNMRMGGFIDGVVRKDLPDYPPAAVREAVTNALMHRDYSPQARGGQVQIDMYADRLEILNPGGLYGPVTVDSMGIYGISASRNQRLSALLEVTPLLSENGFVAENRGTGYAEILDQLASNLLPQPRLKDSLTHFSITFLRRELTKSERQVAHHGNSESVILDFLHNHGAANTRELATVTGLSLNGVRRALGKLVDAGRVERTEPLQSPKQRYRLRRHT